MKARPDVFLVLAMLCASTLLQGQEVYKHQDEKGTTVYSERPGSAGEEAANVGTPNVTTPEATRQIYEKLQRQRTKEALKEQHQQDSVNAAEEATRGLAREQIEQQRGVIKRESERAERRQERGWQEEGDSRANEA